ncbi:MAG: hypothetical protein U0350_43525 [Caldilineaceae bacterium]
MAYAKLRVTRVKFKDNNPPIEIGDPFECQFNPTEFQLSKQNNWNFEPTIGGNAEYATFSGGASEEMTIKLLFDSVIETPDEWSRPREPGKPKIQSVVKKYEKLKALIYVENVNPTVGKGEPPWVLVQWGALIKFVAVMTSFSEQYLRFTPDGTPTRAEVTFSVKEAHDKTKLLPQNPTSASEARRTIIVQLGQRLDMIAYEEYRDPAAWRHIAEANNILNPMALRAGQILKLTPRSRKGK